jgi:hypothetical protein
MLSQGTAAYEEVFDSIAGGSRAGSRRDRGIIEADVLSGVDAGDSGSSTPPTQLDSDLSTEPLRPDEDGRTYANRSE